MMQITVLHSTDSMQLFKKINMENTWKYKKYNKIHLENIHGKIAMIYIKWKKLKIKFYYTMTLLKYTESQIINIYPYTQVLKVKWKFDLLEWCNCIIWILDIILNLLIQCYLGNKIRTPFFWRKNRILGKRTERVKETYIEG